MIRLKRRTKGLAIIEFTLVSSLIFLLLFLITEVTLNGIEKLVADKGIDKNNGT